MTDGGNVKNYLKTTTFAIFALAAFSTQMLSAWYDPTGRWGYCWPNCYNLPSRGKYTVRAELLYLRPHIDNLKIDKAAIARSQPFQNIPGLVVNFTNDERKRRFKWRYGWKVGVGYACYDCWEADLNWTHFQSKAYLADFRGAETKWKVQLDMFDLEIGKEMWFRRCFRLKPFLGLRLAQIKQRYRFEVDGQVTSFAIPGVISPFELNGVLRHNYLALGPRAGFDAQACLGCGFHIYLTGAGAWIWGEGQNRYGDSFVLEGDDKDHHWEGTGITDLTIGLGWSDLWWHETRRLTFRFGYENHWFIHQNRLDNEGAVRRRGHTNWFIQGVSASIVCDF